MPKEKDPIKIFGSSKEQTSAKIAELEQERKDLANKGRLSRKENKRFSALDDIIAQGNEYRSTFEGVPGEERGPEETVIDKKTVIGDDKNKHGSVNKPATTETTQGTANETVATTGGGEGILSDPMAPEALDLGGGVGAGEAPVVGAQGTSITGINLAGGGEQGVGIPDITGGVATPEDPTQKIVQETVAGIQRTDDPTGGVDQEIGKATFGGYPPVKKPEDAMALLDPSVSLGINDPILKGNVSGQIIGNQPVFVGGGDFMAFHAINNRKKAIQDAAMEREQTKRDLMNQTPPIVKDQNFQRSLNNQFFGSVNGAVDKAKEIYGEDWDLALKDQSNPLGREFVQTLANYDFIAGQTDQVTDLIAEIDNDLESGDRIFSEETLALRDEYKNLEGEFLGGNIGGVINLADKYHKLEGYTNLDKIIKDNDIATKGVLTQTANEIINDDERWVTETHKRHHYEEQLHVIAKGLADGQMRDAVRKGHITEDEIFERLNAAYGYESITDRKITTKPSGGGVSVTVDVNSAEEGEEKQKVGEELFDAPYGFSVSSKVKPFNVSGLQVFDANGNTSHIADINEVKINRIQVNRFVDENGNVVYKKVALSDVTEKVPVLDKNGNQVVKDRVLQFEEKKTTRMIDLSVPGVQAQIKTDAVNNFDELNANMDEWISNQGTGETTNTEDALNVLNQ